MAIEFSCPSCMKKMRVKDEAAGRAFKCPSCGGSLLVPDASIANRPSSDGEKFDLLSELTHKTDKPGKPCPKCGKKIDVDAVVCVHCGLDLHSGQRMATRGPQGGSLVFKIAAGLGVVVALVAVYLITQNMQMFGSNDATRIVDAPPPAPKALPRPPAPVTPPTVAVTPTPTPTTPTTPVTPAPSTLTPTPPPTTPPTPPVTPPIAPVPTPPTVTVAPADPNVFDPAMVDGAVAKATKFIVSQYRGDGVFYGKYKDQPGHTALCVYALLRAGVPMTERPIAESLPRLLRYTVAKPGTEEFGTYNCAAVMVALDAVRDAIVARGAALNTPQSLANAQADRVKYTNAINNLMLGLQKNHKSGQGFSFGGGDTKPGNDMSLQQAALLGIFAATRGGMKIGDTFWADQSVYIIRLQAENGGWRLTPDLTATPAMTAAGLANLGLIHALMHRGVPIRRQADPDLGNPANAGAPTELAYTPKTKIEESIERGFAWYAENGMDDVTPYNLCLLERACALTHTTQIAGKNWYQAAVPRICKTQDRDGRWDSEWGGTVSTSFYVLFLTRSTQVYLNGPAFIPAAPATPTPPPTETAPAPAPAPGAPGAVPVPGSLPTIRPGLPTLPAVAPIP